MSTVQGLRPTQQNSERTRSQTAQRLSPQEMQQQIPLQPSAGGVNRYQGVPQAEQNNQLGEFAEALSALNPRVGQYGQIMHEKKVASQQARLPQYIAEMKRDQQLGDIKAVQDKEMFPELVPSVRRQLQEQMGREAGQQVAGELAHAIMSDTTLRWDTEKRNGFIQERMNEILGEMPEGHDLWTSGYLTTVMSTIEGKEAQLLNETAERHRNVLKTKWSEDQLGIFEAAGGGEQGWAAVKEYDDWFNENGAVDKVTRNDALVDFFITEAIRRGDTSYLEVPERFLNRERAAAIEEGYKQIWQDQQRLSRAEQDAEAQHKREQTDVAIDTVVRLLADGQHVSVAHFKDREDIYIDEVADAIHKFGTQGLIDHRISSANADVLTHTLMARSTVEGMGVDRAAMRETIFNAPDINMVDKVKMLDNIDALMDGINIQQHPIVRDIKKTIDHEAMSLNNEVVGNMVAWSMDERRPVEYANRKFDELLNAAVEIHLMQQGAAPNLSETRIMAREAADEVLKDLRGMRQGDSSALRVERESRNQNRGGNAANREEAPAPREDDAAARAIQNRGLPTR